MIEGGKSKYVSLLSLIKDKSRPLYELICDLCLDHTFRTQKYQNTFLMPNEKLVKHIKDLVDKDRDIEAIDVIRSLLLKKHLKKEDFVKGTVIGTLQYTPSVLKDPVAVGALITGSKNEIIATKTGAHATTVLEYKGEVAPATAEGKSGGLVPVGAVTGGVDKNVQLIKDITKKMIVYGDAMATAHNFFKGVSAVLAKLQKHKDDGRFTRAKFYLAANPILSWFFLTLPGSGNGLVTAAELKDLMWESVPDCTIIKEAEEADGYKLDKEFMKVIKGKRSMLASGDRGSLIDLIHKAYDSLADKSSKSIDAYLKKNIHLKLLMDELRFMHDDAVASWSKVDDALATLGNINWSEPGKYLTICDKEVQRSLKMCPEAFVSGPVKFIRSIYLFYVPLTAAVEDQISGAQGGAIDGGNPAEIRNVFFSGGAARKQLNEQSVDGKLASLLSILTEKQKDALKTMLH